MCIAVESSLSFSFGLSLRSPSRPKRKLSEKTSPCYTNILHTRHINCHLLSHITLIHALVDRIKARVEKQPREHVRPSMSRPKISTRAAGKEKKVRQGRDTHPPRRNRPCRLARKRHPDAISATQRTIGGGMSDGEK